MTPSEPLPPCPSLRQLRHRAKDLHRAYGAGEHEAIRRIGESHPRFHAQARGEITLADAQLVIARELGFESWPKLKAHVESLSPSLPGWSPSKTGRECNVHGVGTRCGTGGPEPEHAATIRRMIEQAPPFRPLATPEELVAEFAHGENRMAAFLALYARGPEVLPSIRKGLTDGNWHIRHWCVVSADNFADAETLRALVPLLHDPNAQVRVWAVHSLSCESCKDGPNPVDAVPLLLERIEADTSIKVRRQAVAMLAHHRTPDARVLLVFKRVLAEEADRKLRLHAEHGLKRYAGAGLN